VKKEKILIIHLGGIGDIIVSFPAFRLLRENYGSIYVLCVGRVVPLIREYFHDFKIIEFPFYPFRWNLKNIFKFLIFLILLRRKKFDIVLNFQPITSFLSSIPMFLIFLFSMAKLKCGRDTEGRGWFYDFKIEEKLNEEKFEGEYNLEIVEKLTGKKGVRDFSIQVKEELKQRIEKFSFPEAEKIVICPEGKLKEQRWSWQNFKKLIGLIKEKNFYVVIVGNEKGDYLENKVIDLRGKTDVLDLIIVIDSCSIYIGNDTGPMHIACALGKKVVALFRKETYGHFSWRKERVINLVGKKVNDIKVDEVWKSFLKLTA